MDKIFIQQLAETMGLRPSALAIEAGLAASTLNRRTKDKVEVTHTLSLRSLKKLSDYLEIPFPVLLEHKEAIRKAVENGLPIPDRLPLQSKVENGNNNPSPIPSTVPVYGYSSVSQGELMLDFSTIVTTVPRLNIQSGVRNLYAVENRDSFAVPRYELGLLVHFNTDKFPQPMKGCHVITKSGHVRLVRFLRETEKEYVFQIYKTGKEWSQPKDGTKVHAVIGTDET